MKRITFYVITWQAGILPVDRVFIGEEVGDENPGWRMLYKGPDYLGVSLVQQRWN